jgi:hypothetical protein
MPGSNPVGAATIREFLGETLIALWADRGNVGKRMFGTSSWRDYVYERLVAEGLVAGAFDEDGYVAVVDTIAADELIFEAIRRGM